MRACLTRTLHERATAKRVLGLEWPADAETMIGFARLDNVVACVDAVITDGVPGDLCEAGVWRGGAAIMMKAALASRPSGRRNRRVVWVADSFAGLPPPDPQYVLDDGDLHHTFPFLAVSEHDVRANFARYGLLDDDVRFLVGWFANTLPGPIKQLAVLRCDGDMFGSTWETLCALEPLVSAGGFVIMDDYYLLDGCREATDLYRTQRGITAPLVRIDRCGGFWRKSVGLAR